MGEPVVMFGIGAAKSGTSWLHRYLSDHPECHFRSVKELHYFNSFDWDDLEWNRRRVAEIRDRLKKDSGTDLPVPRLANKVRQVAHVEHLLELLALDSESREAYLGYLNEGREDARVIGEMTPAYSLLSGERLAAMAKIAADVRFVYLLRDPINRLWSHVRMIARARCKAPEEFEARAGNVLKRAMAGKEAEIAKRSDYRSALSKLTSAINPAKLLVGFYEDLFHGDLVDRICQFLGIFPMAPDFAKVVHAGGALPMRQDQRQAAGDWLAPQYQAVQNHFGALPETWTSNLARAS